MIKPKYLGFTVGVDEFEIRPEQNKQTLLPELKMYTKFENEWRLVENEQHLLACLMAFIVGTAQSNAKPVKPASS